jgi:hypothetical protein
MDNESGNEVSKDTINIGFWRINSIMTNLIALIILSVLLIVVVSGAKMFYQKMDKETGGVHFLSFDYYLSEEDLILKIKDELREESVNKLAKEFEIIKGTCDKIADRYKSFFYRKTDDFPLVGMSYDYAKLEQVFTSRNKRDYEYVSYSIQLSDRHVQVVNDHCLSELSLVNNPDYYHTVNITESGFINVFAEGNIVFSANVTLFSDYETASIKQVTFKESVIYKHDIALTFGDQRFVVKFKTPEIANTFILDLQKRVALYQSQYKTLELDILRAVTKLPQQKVLNKVSVKKPIEKQPDVTVDVPVVNQL